MTDQALDPISAALGLDVAVPLTPRPEMKKDDEESPEIEDDYQEARANLKELIQQMMENIPEIVSVMQQSQSDKMYNAASSFIKTAADLNVSLSKLSLDVKKKPKVKEISLKTQTSPQQVTQNNTNVYVGTTENFLDVLSNEVIVDAEAIQVSDDRIEKEEDN